MGQELINPYPTNLLVKHRRLLSSDFFRLTCLNFYLICPFFSLNRRHLLTLSATALSLPAALSSRPSRLVVVGGAEDRLKDKIILRRFLSLCGGESANIVVLTAASGDL